MKNSHLIISFLAIFIGLSVISCVQESAGSIRSDVPYFQFDLADYDKLLQVYEFEDEFVTYENESNKVIRFKVASSTQGREQKSDGGSFFGTSGGSLVYFFDAQRIQLELTEWPDDYDRTEFLIQKTIEDTLKGSIYFPLWNDNTGSSSSTPNTILINFNKAPISITLGAVTYNQVFEIISENDQPLGPLGPYERNVNVLYYDIKDGIVGFNDLEGGQWRLVN